MTSVSAFLRGSRRIYSGTGLLSSSSSRSSKSLFSSARNSSLLGRSTTTTRSSALFSYTLPALSCLSSYSLLLSTNQRSACEHAIVSYPTRRRRELALKEQRSRWTKFKEDVDRAWRMFIRFLKLAFTLAPVTIFFPILMLTASTKREDEDAQDVVLAGPQEPTVGGLLGWYMKLCLRCVEWSGAAVIKLSQWAGSRPDLFGHDFCAVFSQLQDNTTPHSARHTAKVMAEAYGKDWQKRIRLREILGSGCIGQVYRGEVLSETGETVREVAVKVLHPNVEADIDADLDLMRLAVRLVQMSPIDFLRNLKWLNLEGVVEEFAGLLKMQLDCRNEARNLTRFNENFKDDEFVVFPSLDAEFEPSKSVLVETFVKGTPVLQFARENKDDRKKLSNMCVAAINAVCKMIFLDNFMHGDLHPGNVFVSPDGSKFILFDVGIVAEYSESDHDNIVDILAAFVRKQGRKAGRLMIDDSNERLVQSKSGDRAFDEEKYIDKIEHLTIQATSEDYLMEHLGTYITYICDAAAHHHIWMNPAFVSAALAVKVQEGIALALDPSIRVGYVAIPIVVESEKRRRLARFREKYGVNKVMEFFTGGDDKQEEHVSQSQ